MTKLLDDAVAQVRELSEEEQELAAEALLTFAKLAKQGIYELSVEERAAISDSRNETEQGDFPTDDEIEAAYARFRS